MSSEIIGELGQVGLRISKGTGAEQQQQEEEEEERILSSDAVSSNCDQDKKRSPKSLHYSTYRTKRFRSEWMNNDIFKDWLRPHSCPEFAICSACNRVIKAGKSELEKHASGKKHIKMLKMNCSGGSGSGAVAGGPSEGHQSLVLVGQADPQQSPYTEATFVVNLTENGSGSCEGGSFAAGSASQYVEVTQYEAQPAQPHIAAHPQNHVEPPHHHDNHVHSHTQTHVPEVAQVRSLPHPSPPPADSTAPPHRVADTPPFERYVLRAAPHWKTTAVVNGHVTSLDLNDYRGRYLIMLFYSHDFCKVSCSEVNSVSDAMGELRALGAEAVACSVDSYLCHLTWYKMTRLDNGILGAKVALLSDPTHVIAKSYGVYLSDKGHALRACFIIDKNGIIRHMSINDPSIGRGTPELIRLLRAIQHNDRTEESCYADWKPND